MNACETNATAFAADLRTLAKLIENRPHLAPYLTISLGTVSAPVGHCPDPIGVMREFARAGRELGAAVTAGVNANYGYALIDFGGGLVLKPYADKNKVCPGVPPAPPKWNPPVLDDAEPAVRASVVPAIVVVDRL